MLLKKVILPFLDPNAFPVKIALADGMNQLQADMSRLQAQAPPPVQFLRS